MILVFAFHSTLHSMYMNIYARCTCMYKCICQKNLCSNMEIIYYWKYNTYLNWVNTSIGQLSFLGRYYKGSFLGGQSDRQTDEVLIPALEISDDCQQAHRVSISYHTEFVHTEPGRESHTRLRRKYPLPWKKNIINFPKWVLQLKMSYSFVRTNIGSK